MAKKLSVWDPILPIPEDAPEPPLRHGNRGEPLWRYTYHDSDGNLLGQVCRFLHSTGEPLHLPLTWCKDQDDVRAWRWVQFQRLRPMYGLRELAKAKPRSEEEEEKQGPYEENSESGFDDQTPVVICYDECAAWHARKLLPWALAVSWPGGTRNIDEVDWVPLKGRIVLVWPTLERRHAQLRKEKAASAEALPRDRQPLWQAALKLEKIALGYGCTVLGIVDPWADAALPEGFDAGMAGMQDWTTERAQAWLFSHLREGEGTVVQQRIRALRGEPAKSISTPTEADAGQAAKSAWVPDLIFKGRDLAVCLSNVYQILANRKEWHGAIALDEFALKIRKLKPPPFAHGVAGEWCDADDARTAMWLQREYEFTPSSALVREAVATLADAHRYNPVRSWLDGLRWDGESRLTRWLVKYLGAPDTDYTMLVGKWWLMGAVKRALQPGCKFDYVLVLEGLQGKKKSSFFEALAGEWFGDADLDFSNKEAMMALQGKLIYEIAELGALARSDERRQKSFLSRRFDEFRPPYGRGFVKMPRQLVFAGTTNEWEWNKDPTGGRRFWPIACLVGEIDVAGMLSDREQLFAEAMYYVTSGERYWPTADEQKTLFDPEQLKIEQPDALVDALHDWVYARVSLFSLYEAASDGLKIDASKLTRDTQTRIGIALRKLGCTKHERINGMTRFWYKPPAEAAKSRTGQPAQHGAEVGDVPF